jgi:hypothetical protein
MTFSQFEARAAQGHAMRKMVPTMDQRLLKVEAVVEHNG